MDPDLGYLMKVVEEYKYRLTDGEYLEICNALKNAHHKIKGRNRENFVRRIRKVGFRFGSSYFFASSCFVFAVILSGLKKLLYGHPKHLV